MAPGLPALRATKPPPEYIEAQVVRPPATPRSAKPSPTSATTPSRRRWSASRRSPRTYAYDAPDGFLDMNYSGSGNVTAPLSAVDLNLAGDRASTSGCEAADFGGFTAGNIALIQRGTCTFRIKADNAAAAGAAGVIIFNQGNADPADERFALFGGTLDAPQAGIPVVSTSFATGAELAGLNGVSMHLAVELHRHQARPRSTSWPTPADARTAPSWWGRTWIPCRKGRASTTTAPGSAAILETAIQLKKSGTDPREQGPLRLLGRGGGTDLIGSDFYDIPADGAPDQGPRGQPQLRHGRLAELCAASSTTATAPPSATKGPNGSGAGREGLPGLLQVPEPAYCADASSTGAPTTPGSSTTGFRRVACSPARKTLRRRRKRQCSAGHRTCRAWTPATTRPATPSPTSTPLCWSKWPTRSPTRH